MLKKFYLLFCLILFLSLAACGGQEDINENNGTNEENLVEEPQENEQDEEHVEEEEKNGELDAGDQNNNDPQTNDRSNTGNESTSSTDSDSNEPEVYENEVFKDIIVSESEGQYTVTGKAQVFEGVFQYKLHDGNTVLLENNYQTDGAPAWGDFKITFETDLVSSDNVLLELFVYSAKDGSKINVLEIPINL